MTARTDDYDEIVRVVKLYIDGFNENDIEKFKEAFHEDAWIFYICAEGGLHKNLISENFEEWASPPSSGIVGRIISDTGGRCCFGPAQLRPQGQALWMDRLPQSAQDQRGLEDHEQDCHPQQQVDLAICLGRGGMFAASARSSCRTRRVKGAFNERQQGG